ncbi:hypothetical protein ACHQM5_027241 [Ranunculus cassubicifolius]
MAQIRISTATMTFLIISIISAVTVSAQDYIAPSPEEAMPPSMTSGSASSSLSAMLLCSSVALSLMALLKH